MRLAALDEVVLDEVVREPLQTVFDGIGDEISVVVQRRDLNWLSARHHENLVENALLRQLLYACAMLPSGAVVGGKQPQPITNSQCPYAEV